MVLTNKKLQNFFILVVLLFITKLSCAQDRSTNCQAVFKYYNGAGEFVIGEGVTKTSLGSASAGYAFTSNEESFTTMKDFGAIPPGRYRITVYTGDRFKNVPNVFDVVPMPGTETHGRTDFKIHGLGKSTERVKTPAESSNGCIILLPEQRTKLKQYFETCGKEIELLVTNN